MIRAPGDFHAGEMFAIPFPITTENDDAFAGVIARAPQPIALVITDRFGQTIFLAEEIDRASLAVAVGENRRLCALVGRKRFINAADFAGHLFPAKFIGEMLGQRPVLLVLGF